MTLTGQLTGSDRADIEKQAEQIAARYFDTECVSVVLSEETADTAQIEFTTLESALPTFGTGETVFTANWKATVEHRPDRLARGFPRCVRCGLGPA